MSSWLLRIMLSLGGVFGGTPTAFGQGGSGGTQGGSGGAQGGSGSGGANTITNPLSCDDFVCVTKSVIGALFWISIPIATIMILVGAFQILTAAGDPEKFRTGKNTIVYAVVGLAAIIVGLGAVDLIQNLLGVSQ